MVICNCNDLMGSDKWRSREELLITQYFGNVMEKHAMLMRRFNECMRLLGYTFDVLNKMGLVYISTK